MSIAVRHTAGVDTTQGGIRSQLLALFFPLMLGTLFQQLYNTTDAIILGQFVGKQALAAVGGTTGNIINFIVGMFIGISAGETVSVAQLFGAKQTDRISDTVHTGIAFSLAGGAVMTVVGFLVTPTVLHLMNTTEDVFPYAVTYLRVIMCGMVPVFLYNMGCGILRAVGDTRRPLYFLISGCLTNIVLDLLFVAVFGWGTFGAAIATVMSQVLSTVLLSICLLRTDSAVRVHVSRIRIHAKPLAEMLRVGVPAGVQSNMYSFSNIIIQSFLNTFGTDTMAAWTAYGKIDGLFWLTLGALGTAVTAFVGQNFGAGKYDRIFACARTGLRLAAAGTAVFTAFVLVFSRPLIMLFTQDPAVVGIGHDIMYELVPFFCLHICTELLAGTIRGCGESVRPMLITVFGICALRIVWMFTVLPIFPTFRTLLLSYPISWGVTGVVFIFYYRRRTWIKRCQDRAASRSAGRARSGQAV